MVIIYLVNLPCFWNYIGAQWYSYVVFNMIIYDNAYMYSYTNLNDVVVVLTMFLLPLMEELNFGLLNCLKIDLIIKKHETFIFQSDYIYESYIKP